MITDFQTFFRETDRSLCLSGGAKGSDVAWGNLAKMLGHWVIHWSFEDHKAHVTDIERLSLNAEQLRKANHFVLRANKTLLRKFPTRYDSTNNLLRRNWYQVAWTKSLYGVGVFKNGDIDGGTAWAVQMYIDRFTVDRENIDECKLYFFDQIKGIWLTWKYEWKELQDRPPVPTGVWTGIGTRKLNENGSKQIKEFAN